MAEKKLGRVSVHFGAEAVRPGGTVEGSIRFRPRAGVELEGATLLLMGQERAVSGSGTNETTYRHEILSRRMTLCGPRRVAAGEEVALSASIALPADAATTFDAGNNHVAWWIEVHVAILKWPDWVRTYPIVVGP
jgi:hypothetical protein